MTMLKTAAALLALLAPSALSAAYGDTGGPERAPVAPAATAPAEPAGRTLAMSIGKPTRLTSGEQQALRTLVPGLDPASIPPARVGKLRAILYNSKANDAEKRSRIESLLR